MGSELNHTELIASKSIVVHESCKARFRIINSRWMVCLVKAGIVWQMLSDTPWQKDTLQLIFISDMQTKWQWPLWPRMTWSTDIESFIPETLNLLETSGGALETVYILGNRWRWNSMWLKSGWLKMRERCCISNWLIWFLRSCYKRINMPQTSHAQN